MAEHLIVKCLFLIERRLGHMEHKLMAAIDDLKSAISDLSTALADNNAEIDKLLTQISAPDATDAEIAAATQSIRDLISANQSEVAKARAAAP